MSNTAPFPKTSEVVSPRGYAWLLGDPWLRRAVIPGGLLSSPYEILDYHSVLTLHDADGMHATYARTQTIRFIHDDVYAILDHAYGAGILAADYANTAGPLDGSFKDQEWQHFVVALRRRGRRGQTLRFHVRREARAGFLDPDGWLETTLDHPVAKLEAKIVFPAARPCGQPTLELDGLASRLAIAPMPDGRSLVTLRVKRPLPFLRYIVRWRW